MIRRHYQERINEYQQRLEALDRQSTWMSRFRGMTFLPAVALAICGWTTGDHIWWWYGAATAFLLSFIALCNVHENILQRLIEVRHRRSMNRIQLARLDRRWSDIPEVPFTVPTTHQSVTRDLDLIGPASLFQLVSLAHTPFGRETLRDWLLVPATADEVALRQGAVTLLAPDVEFREELDLRGRLLAASVDGPKEFVQWAESPPWLAARGWLRWLTRLLAFASIVVAVVGLLGIVDATRAGLAFLGIVVVNVLVTAVYIGKVYEIFNSVSSRNHDIQNYRPLFEAIAGLPQENAYLAALRARMGKTPHEPIRLLRGLTRIIGFANLRKDGLFGVPYMISQMFWLTDFHVLYFLERWQQRHGAAVREWLESVGQLEAISSLATLAHDHPAWTLPVVRDDFDKKIEGEALGHPLLPDDQCVRNDVQIGPAGTFLLVTGSNMSGKSTLLRAVGVNVALAQAGGPVCAASFRLPPLDLATSMRIHDSLADGVSFFMAELKRLKQIVDQCRDDQQSGDRTLLYLLDEILQGTNSAERHIAVSHVIKHLVRNGAMGAVSTHDLALANSPELVAACQPVHFRETIVGQGAQQKMTFDYKLQSGVAPTTNALKLLELVGLVDHVEKED